MSTMIFSTLFFLGLFIMFFFILRGQEKLLKTISNDLAQTRAKLHLVEMRLANLAGEDSLSSIQDLDMSQTQKNQPSDSNGESLKLNLDPIDFKKS